MFRKNRIEGKVMRVRFLRVAVILFFSVLFVKMETAGAQSALPSASGSQNRSPGLSLSSDDSFDNPFAPVQEVIPKTAEEVEGEIREQAFNAAITGLLPLNPEEIRNLLEHFDETQQAVEIPVYPYPKPEVVVETVSFDPGAKPPVLKVASGHVSTLTILDVTGAPWPIRDVTWAGNFEVIEPGEGGHVIRVTPTSEFAYGNMSILLLELKTPITFTLRVHRDVVQYRFDARIPEFGPYANVPLIDGGLTLVAGDATINAVLDGVLPSGAQKLDVDGADSRTTAYKYNAVTYVRTPLTLLSPGWSSSVSSADGMHVYTVSNAPVLLLSDRGTVVRARLNDRETSDE